MSVLYFTIPIKRYRGNISMEMILPFAIAIVLVVMVWAWQNTNGRLFAKVRGVLSVCLLGAVTCLAVLTIYTVVVLGATSVEDILAMLL